jgi:FlaA1/EpsC-like NDP-sugar epimerase
MIYKIALFVRKMHKKLPVLLCDFFAIPVAWFGAYWLRYNMQPFPSLISSRSSSALSLLILIQVLCYFYFKTYRGLWRFFSLNDLMRILKASFTAVVLAIPVLYLSSMLHNIPRSVFPLYFMMLTTFLCGTRLLRRIYWDRHSRTAKETEIQRILIIGAGMAGEGLARDLKRSSQYNPIGFIDDNLDKRGLEVHGVPVLGTTKKL